ncbi:hypothetical protein KFL_000130100 [Klebsormidium nitens]|uniref:YbaK/aminoacyl-tRNA synthetase-associated domain-containing protein n=1 Tax=Klebsormidium nitens TaxID=105231 RepID=A0A1Y1HRG3_KLENI|nr:hypothetical protein KFL_000130100 [Klebsormidium nitens]|eukprot:GAQ78428.1 hypothetical protein KFL_000130100 [Klebsormidium nitens]
MTTLEAAQAAKEKLLSYLAAQGIDTENHEHPPVMTVEAQAEHFKERKDIQDAVSKNLFLKDKKDRLYLISALVSTTVDMKKIALRLGVGKSGIRFAPEETLRAVLQVPLGSATPFAVFNETAKPVALLLDKKLQSKPKVYHHPFTNNATTGIAPLDFDKFLRSLGREPVYVDLEAELVLGKDGADLAQYALEPVPSEKSSKPAGDEEAISAKTGGSESALAGPPVPKSKPAAKGKKANGPTSTGPVTKAPAGDNVTATLDRMLETITATLKTDASEGQTAEDPSMKTLRIELQSHLTLFKNAAYTNGFLAGQVTKPLVR